MYKLPVSPVNAYVVHTATTDTRTEKNKVARLEVFFRYRHTEPLLFGRITRQGIIFDAVAEGMAGGWDDDPDATFFLLPQPVRRNRNTMIADRAERSILIDRRGETSIYSGCGQGIVELR